MIDAVKNDKVSIALFCACIIAALLLLTTWVYIALSLFYSQAITPTRVRTILQHSGFVIGEPIPADQPGLMRYPCLTPHGQICTLKYNEQGRIVEMGIMFGSSITPESVKDIRAISRIIALKWDATEWINQAIANGEGKTVRNGYKFEISTSPVLSFFVVTPEDK